MDDRNGFRHRDERPSFRDIARSSADRAEAAAQARFVDKHRAVIESLEQGGHSIAFWTKRARGEAGSVVRVTMGCNNCWKKYRGPFHRWWGLSPTRRCG